MLKEWELSAGLAHRLSRWASYSVLNLAAWVQLWPATFCCVPPPTPSLHFTVVIKKGFNVTIIDYYYFHRWTAEKGLHVTRSSVSISPHPYYPPLSHGPSTRSSLHPWICGLPLSHSQMQSSGMEKVHPTITVIAKCFDLNLIFFLPSFNFFVCHISKGWITNLSRQTLQIY